MEPILTYTDYSSLLISSSTSVTRSQDSESLCIYPEVGCTSSGSNIPSPSAERNPIFSEEEDGEWEWCEDENLGIKIGRKVNMVRVLFETKAFVCDFSTHTIGLYKPSKCYFPKEEKCFIRGCYDLLRDKYPQLSKKQVAFVIYNGIYDSKITTCETPDICNAISSIQQRVLQTNIQFLKGKQVKHIQQLLYNFARFDSFKNDYNWVLQELDSQYSIRSEKRAFDLVYCAYYEDGYSFGSIADDYNSINVSIINGIRCRKPEMKSKPSPKSVQYGIGIYQFNSYSCLI